MSQPQPLAGQRTIQPTHVVLRFFRDAMRLPGWMKIVLFLASVSGLVGLGGQLTGPVNPTTQPAVTTVQNSPAPQADHPTMTRIVTPWMTRIGFSVVLGYIVGWAFRSFVKLMALVAVLFGAILSGLSYFHIINVDMTAAANSKYATVSSWIIDQAGHLRDGAARHIPSSGAGFFGLMMGLKRRY